jgi:predicted amidophosphoribosyltransferase
MLAGFCPQCGKVWAPSVLSCHDCDIPVVVVSSNCEDNEEEQEGIVKKSKDIDKRMLLHED